MAAGGFERSSGIAHAAYHDLLRGLLDERVSEIRGAPTLKQRGDRAYWYDKYRVGDETRTKYIQEDSEEFRARLKIIEDLKARREERRRERARLVRLLRAEGLLSVDAGTGRLLAALSDAGVFRLGGTLVGTNAFRLFEGELGIRIRSDEATATDDVDIASFERLSLALEDVVDPSIREILADFSFEPVPSLARGQVWKWRQTKRNTLVEFLTPSFTDDEGLRELPALGVSAQALHHLNYLIADPIKAAALYRSGVLVQIPRPERFAIHKLIVADRRRDGVEALKARKDRAQAAFLIEVLAEDRPDDLAEAYEDAKSRGARWRERIERSLERMPESAARLAAL